MGKYVCNRCSEEVFEDDYCVCGKCGAKYHFVCSTLKKSTWLGYGPEKQKKWKCSRCREGAEEQRSEGEIGMADLLAKLDIIIDKYEETKKEVVQLKSFVIDLKDELIKRDNTIKALNERISVMEQGNRVNKLEISNLPKQDKENLRNIVVNIIGKLGVQITDNDIDAVYRLPGNRNQTIVVVFSGRRIRDEVWNKKKTVVTCQEIVGTGQGKIYINPNLNKYFRDLRYKTKQAAEKAGYRYVWFANNKILVRKNDKDRQIITITREEDIRKIGQTQSQHSP